VGFFSRQRFDGAKGWISGGKVIWPGWISTEASAQKKTPRNAAPKMQLQKKCDLTTRYWRELQQRTFDFHENNDMRIKKWWFDQQNL
jgi:hypothetical protein